MTGRLPINRLDHSISHEITIRGEHKAEMFLNVENLTNLINDDWGQNQLYLLPYLAPTAGIDATGQWTTFAEPNPSTLTLPSLWSIQIGARYRF